MQSTTISFCLHQTSKPCSLPQTSFPHYIRELDFKSRNIGDSRSEEHDNERGVANQECAGVEGREGDCTDTIDSEESSSSDREESDDGEAMCDIEVYNESSESEGNEESNIYDVDGEMLNIESENQAPSTSGPGKGSPQNNLADTNVLRVVSLHIAMSFSFLFSVMS